MHSSRDRSDIVADRDLYFITDIVLNFRTAFVNEQDVRETSPKAIAKYYMSGWFPIDFISECSNGRLELVTVAAL